jgi:WD40 repeat protein
MTLPRWLLFAAFVAVPGMTQAAEPMVPTGPVSFYKDVRPIFQQHCQGCHQPAKAQGAYVMTSYADLLKTGDSGKPGVSPGKPDASYLLDEIRVKDNKAEMPKNGSPLTKVQYDTIEKWIKEGAKDDTPPSAKAVLIDADHPPKYVAPPVITSLAFSPDGKFLAVTGYHEILLYDAETWKLTTRLVGLSERVQAVAWSPDGKSLAAAAGDPGRFGEVQVWDVAKKKLTISTPVSYDTLFGLSWSPDGSLIAVGCTDNNVRAINTSNGKLVLQMGTHSDWVLATVFSQDSQHLASAGRDMSMKLTEVSTQRFVDNVTSITPNALKGGLMAIDRRPLKEKKMAKVPNDTPNAPAKVYDELLAGGSDGIPRLYKMHREQKREIGDDANKLKQFEAMIGRISTVKFNERGTTFAAASSLDGKGEVSIFDVNTGKKTFLLPKVSGPAYAVAWHPDGYSVASAGFDGKVWIHDAMDGSVILEFTVKP